MPRSHVPQTLRRPVIVEGNGLHRNQPCRVKLLPVDHSTGLIFHHRPSGQSIPVHAEFAGPLQLATTLQRKNIQLQTVEHLLSALMGLEVENLIIEVEGEELPILDGSAAPWVEKILEAGIRALPGTRKFIRILRPIEIVEGQKRMKVSPRDNLRVRYTIDFNHPALGRQSRELTMSPEKYHREVGEARTFCMERDIEAMRARGLAQGGSLDNAVVYGPHGPLNEVLRFEDEAVRHKILDLVGDLALLGAPLLGLVEAHAAGHAMHVAFVRAILDQKDAWTWSEAPLQRSRLLLPESLSEPIWGTAS